MNPIGWMPLLLQTAVFPVWIFKPGVANINKDLGFTFIDPTLVNGSQFGPPGKLLPIVLIV